MWLRVSLVSCEVQVALTGRLHRVYTEGPGGCWINTLQVAIHAYLMSTVCGSDSDYLREPLGLSLTVVNCVSYHGNSSKYKKMANV